MWGVLVTKCAEDLCVFYKKIVEGPNKSLIKMIIQEEMGIYKKNGVRVKFTQ